MVVTFVYIQILHAQHVYSILYIKNCTSILLLYNLHNLYLRFSLDFIVTIIDVGFKLKILSAEQFLILDISGRVEPGDSNLSTSPGNTLILYFNKHGVQP